MAVCWQGSSLSRADPSSEGCLQWHYEYLSSLEKQLRVPNSIYDKVISYSLTLNRKRKYKLNRVRTFLESLIWTRRQYINISCRSPNQSPYITNETLAQAPPRSHFLFLITPLIITQEGVFTLPLTKGFFHLISCEKYPKNMNFL